MDNEILVKKAIKGNDEAFYKLISENKVKLYKMAFTYLKNEQDSLEAIQEVTYRAYKNIKKIKEPKFFSTWIVRILLNYCMDELKRKNKTLTLTKEIESKSSEISSDKVALDMALDKLNDNYKNAIILKYYQGFTIKEISKIMNSPEGTIKTWLSRGLGILKNTLNKEGEFSV